jgi:hypothetical protein
LKEDEAALARAELSEKVTKILIDCFATSYFIPNPALTKIHLHIELAVAGVREVPKRIRDSDSPQITRCYPRRAAVEILQLVG